jgi:hypothetical protein
MPVEIPNVGRDDLALLFVELGYQTGVELGVERGLYSEILCRANPEVTLYSVDAWQCYKGYRVHVDQKHLDEIYADAQKRLSPYDCHLIRKFSIPAAETFKPASLDFVYIDGNHALEYVVADIAAWLPKIRPGGILAGHDYRKTKNSFQMHVMHGVQAYTDAYRVRPWFVLGRKSPLTKEEIRDKNRSWMWVV